MNGRRLAELHVAGLKPSRDPNELARLEAVLDRMRENNKWVAGLGATVAAASVFELSSKPTGLLAAALILSLVQAVVGVIGAVPLSGEDVNPAEQIAHLRARFARRQFFLRAGVGLFFIAVGCIAWSVLQRIP